MEDIDNWGGNSESHLTNFLDGIGKIDALLVVATTNYLEKVSPRLRARPGRFDEVLAVGYPGAAVRRAFLASKLGADSDKLDELTALTAGISMAHIKEVIVRTLILGGCTAETMKTLREQCGASAPPPAADDDDDLEIPDTVKAALTRAARSL